MPIVDITKDREMTPPVPSEYGGNVRVYESSTPHIWINVTSPENLNEPDGEQVEAVALLTADNARTIADALNRMADRLDSEETA